MSKIKGGCGVIGNSESRVIIPSKSMWHLREVFGRPARECRGRNKHEVRFFMGNIRQDAL